MSEQEPVPDKTVYLGPNTREVEELVRTERRERALLEAIHRAHTQFILAEDSSGIFSEILESMLTLTDSEYGFVGEMFQTEEGQPYLTTRAITDIAWNDESREWYEQFINGILNFDNLNSLYGVAMSSGTPVIANDAANDLRRAGTPAGHPRLDAFLGLPLISNSQEFVGLIGLANRPGGYDQELIDYLQPIVAACANLVAARKNDQRRQQAERELHKYQQHLKSLVEQRTAEFTREQQRLKSLVENIPASVFRKDLEGRFTFVNKIFCEMMGQQPDEILGRTDFDLSPRDLAIKFRKDDQTVIETGRVFEDIQELEKPSGRIYGQVLKTPVHDSQGDVAEIQGIFWDVTARKRAEQQLVLARESAEAANRAKSDFLANMSHEIRTPLNAIIGMTDLVLDTELDVTQRDYLTIVSESAESLLSIINEILDFSKIEAGKVELESVEFDLREELGDTLKSLGLRAHAKSLELVWHVDVDVPNWLSGDRVRLRQILINLVGNAVKFTERGEVMVDVRHEDRDGSRVTLHMSVRDTGIGIPDSKQSAIFAAFEQVDSSTTREYGGTGLGLAITAQIVDAMDGRIWVDSTPGQGSTFHVTADFLLAAPQQEEELPNLNGLPVVIVDDNETNRRILAEMLQSWGMLVESVEGAPQALEVLQRSLTTRSAPPLVISDVNMPKMDGFMLAEEIRATASLHDAVIILLTSGGRTGESERCEGLGVAAHLIKPVKQSELLDAIMLAVRPDSTFTRMRTSTRSEPEPQMPSCKILLAEDGLANQKMAVALLRTGGHEVTVVENGQEAIQQWQNGDFDLILMDIQMPILDGLDATRQIRELEHGSGRYTPIVAMTARAMKRDRASCLAAGMDDFISKPVRRPDLYRVLRSVIAEQQGNPAKRPADAVVDWDIPLQTADGNRELVLEIVEVARQEIPILLSQLDEAITARDAKTAQRMAHTIKGEASVLGAARVEKGAASIEEAAENHDLDLARQYMPQFRQAVDEALEECQHFVRNE